MNQLQNPQVVSRFWDKVRKRDDCWLWVGHKNTMTGYGLFAVARGDIREAYLVSYEMKYGPIPEPERPQITVNIDQTCKNRQCVNPDHVSVTFGGERVRREREKALSDLGIHPNSNEARSQRTHCAQGHEYTEENTIRRKNTRRCRTCKNTQSRETRQRRREEKERSLFV